MRSPSGRVRRASPWLALLLACSKPAPGPAGDGGAVCASCAWNQTCVLGACYDVTCGAEVCPAGTVCFDSQCTPAACLGVTCATDQLCDSTGQCLSTSCGSTACPPGDVCSQGACVAAACAGLSCGTGQVCANGMCYPTACGTLSCAPGNACVDAGCVPAYCAGPLPCPTGTRCTAAGCESTACGPLQCSGGGVCEASGKACVAAACAGASCASGSACVDGACFPTSCGAVACAQGSVCRDGTHCVAACAGAFCADGGVCTPEGCGGAATSGGSTGGGGYALGGCTAFEGCDGSQVTVIAGTGVAGFQDGDPATFQNPQGVAVDGQGDVIVADTGNQAIREIQPSGKTVTLAGNGDAGYLDGPAAAALFDYPTGVAVDSSGRIYVADQLNRRIRVVSAGTVETLAGNGRAGSTDGPGGPDGGAEFLAPAALALDVQGNCYVADTGSIRVVSPAGDVTTLARITGTIGPSGVSVDPAGNVFATDGTQVFEVRPDGGVSVLAGSLAPGFLDGLAVTSLWSESLHGAAVDATDDVYVADFGNAVIRRIDYAGYVADVAGRGDGGLAGGGGAGGGSSLDGYGLALDPAGANLYAVDPTANQVAKVKLGCAPSAIPQVCCHT
ncbi:MAG TPA: hypothetical protein VMB50_08610, partial [Myxococcales bacterium]|nr:hypothetical protein [Myxococcales bacterium]